MLEFLKRPEASIYAGGLLLVASVIGSAIATKYAIEKLEEIPEVNYLETKEKVVEKAKILIPAYAPVVILTGAGLYLIVTGSNKYAKQYAAAASAYLMVSERLQTVSSEVGKKLGPRAMNNLMDAANSNISPKSSISPDVFNSDRTIVYDPLSDRYFTVDDVDDLRKAVLRCNEQLYAEDFIPINHLYLELGLNKIFWGEESGWYIDQGTITVELGAALVEYDNQQRPVVLLLFKNAPELVALRNGGRV